MRFLLLIVLLFLGVSGAQLPETEPTKPNAESKADEKNTEAKPPIKRVVGKPTPNKPTSGCANDCGSEQEETAKASLAVDALALSVNAQSLDVSKEALKISREVYCLAVIMAAIAVVQVFLFGWQLSVMGRANDTAAEAAKAALSQARFIVSTEKAFLVCGGLFGQRNTRMNGVDKTRPEAWHFKPPWRMVIHNTGKTPGTVISVEWGLQPDSNIFRVLKVSEILDGKMLTTGGVEEVREIIPPTEGNTPIYYRYVEPVDRPIGSVFFGRIKYTDVFGNRWFTTFCYLLTVDNSKPIGLSFENDHGEIRQDKGKQEGPTLWKRLKYFVAPKRYPVF